MFKVFHSIFHIPYSIFSFPARREKAFTLLELLIVIGITTILSGVGITYYASQRKGHVLDATAREITGYLRYVQRKSVAQQEGKQWGVHFENPSSGSDFYALYTGASYSTPIETRYLPAGIEFQKPTSGNSIDISFSKLTGAFSGTYKQIILKNNQSQTINVLACAQGTIEENSDISLCGFVDNTPPVIGTIIPENTSYNSFVDSPFDLTAPVNDSEGGVTSCEYTTDGGSTWLAADLSGTGPDYTCTKTGITSSDGTALSLNMRATSSGGTGTGTAVSRTVDTVAPTVSDDWTDDWTASSTVDITLTSSDGSGSGVASTKYCVDTDDSCTPSTEGTSLSVSCDSGATCIHYVRYEATDNVDNVSSIYSKRVRQDLQAPSDGTLTATPGYEEVDLSWSDFSDAGIGLRSTDTYKLVYSTSTTPTDCNDGTQIYLGTDTSYNHTGLTNGDTYYYRVCAFDELDHMSSGATAQATISDTWYCDEDNDGHYAEASAASCPSGRYSSSAGNDCDDSCATCYPGSTAYTTSPDGLDQDCDGTVDEDIGVDKLLMYMADFRYKGDLGGRSGADDKCDLGSTLHCVSGKNRAFLSVNSNDEIRDMPNNYGYYTNAPIYWYRRDDGSTLSLANDWADMLDGSIINSQNDGTNDGYHPWSGSNSDGSVYSSDETCSGWTSNSENDEGWSGYSTATNADWLDNNYVSCDENMSLRCICEVDKYQ